MSTSSTSGSSRMTPSSRASRLPRWAARGLRSSWEMSAIMFLRSCSLRSRPSERALKAAPSSSTSSVPRTSTRSAVFPVGDAPRGLGQLGDGVGDAVGEIPAQQEGEQHPQQPGEDVAVVDHVDPLPLGVLPFRGHAAHRLRRRLHPGHLLEGVLELPAHQVVGDQREGQDGYEGDGQDDQEQLHPQAEQLIRLPWLRTGTRLRRPFQ